MNDDFALRTLAADALKTIARDEQIKSHISNSEELYPLLYRAARRYITGETKEDAVFQAVRLNMRGYATSLEYIGENVSDERECTESAKEFLRLIGMYGTAGRSSTISLDLSHIGMTVDEELAYRHLEELIREAAIYGMTIMISAEESFKASRIIGIYKRAASSYPNVGITLQAHLHRAESDMEEIKHFPGRIRIVKGAFRESEADGVPRSEHLKAKYLRLAETAIATGRPVSIATHDETIHREARERGLIALPNVEVEMLYGIRPDLLKGLKDDGYRTRIYLPYGKEWHLYFFHRLSEYPPNLYRAIADMAMPSGSEEMY
ncbi:proline dehydrogenase family protein [Cohnella herbarum]|uniref:proline dehydrogenase n=1 Tax=Cohnella herbarum TaxID=2728023 RepID=A0A7Z2VM84_9BACL|nr:proline dehydrogenase family protein [Cohnella herbarum]QJD85514.1 proline dehydrogenase [Cohnella herbarum]